MRGHPILLVLLAAASFCGCATRSGVLISREEMDELPDNKPLRRIVHLDGVRVAFEFEKTTKGNGMLLFPGGGVRNYDNHNDDIIFQPYALDTRLIGRDLEVSGIGVRFDANEQEIERRPVRAVFRFEPATRKFSCVVSDPWIYAKTE